MKIIDEIGNLIENPDLTLGYLKDDPEIVHHDATAAVDEISHYEAIAEYPNGGKDVEKVIDVPGIPAKEAYDETVERKRYVLYTSEELLQQERAKEKAEQESRLPTVEERLAALEAAMLDLLEQEA